MNDKLIITPNDVSADSKKYGKSCADFQCLNDGTITGDYHYCNLSTQCMQYGIDAKGKPIPMVADYLPIADPLTGEITEHQLFCTGMYDIRPLKERIDDDKVS